MSMKSALSRLVVFLSISPEFLTDILFKQVLSYSALSD